MYDRGVVDAPNFQTEMRQLLRERIIDAGRRIVVTEGWGAVNMSRLAKEVGVSRPVLYKEFGNKHELAEVVIQQEVDGFLVGIAESLAAHPTDVAAGFTAAVEYTLRTGADNTLLKAVLAGRSATDTALLPVLMTETEPVLGRAIVAVSAAIRAQYGLAGVADDELTSMTEVLVRLALSHLFQPTGPVDRAVEQIRRVIVGAFGAALES
ncbi:TetR family transcriptional regulator [Nocardia sp. CDC160]|uniref:TetR family transcriptional regulator n=1 Tax=Nocardia sp. CDC160 TaxID=3112166 RepID=UPI002DBEFD79|nr:TetR family transcriptional regulator [Nocardia sp. CDC160]MEC3918745.1 TetR family transcriptional regulator [Nocardia sp. CDC160]